ncbi:hypothetical protein TNCV_2562741 [Trichonephila clavipes]|uniref:Uncharacterized protein n=1 Tax=Trichonephila clavipes TaxID=2585209 RepID=A0A8X6R9N7_TRICX|nr:hypothetical protein TNCV_2562741 [Trichonephila clavipes]
MSSSADVTTGAGHSRESYPEVFKTTGCKSLSLSLVLSSRSGVYSCSWVSGFTVLSLFKDILCHAFKDMGYRMVPVAYRYPRYYSVAGPFLLIV